MRRVWIVMAGTVVIAGLVSGPTVAYATTDTSRQAVSCGDLIKKYQKSNKIGAGVNFNNPKTFPKLFKQAASILKSLASNGPSELRAAFKHLAAGFSSLAKIDFTNPSAFTQLASFGAAYSADLQKIAAYFSTKCNYTIPTSPSGAGGAPAGVPTS